MLMNDSNKDKAVKGGDRDSSFLYGGACGACGAATNTNFIINNTNAKANN